MLVLLLLVVSIGVNVNINVEETTVALTIYNEMGTLPIFPPIG